MKTITKKGGEFAHVACNGSGTESFSRCVTGYVAGYEACIGELVFKGNYLKIWNQLTMQPKLSRTIGNAIKMHSADVNTNLRQMQKKSNVIGCITEGRFKYWFRYYGEK